MTELCDEIKSVVAAQQLPVLSFGHSDPKIKGDSGGIAIYFKV